VIESKERTIKNNQRHAAATVARLRPLEKQTDADRQR